jgi:osmoprotectant transport system ATP-binding protein
MIRLHNISKYYGEIKATSSVDLACEAGETTVLIGPSGSGKSTVLRVIIGLIIPDSGEVMIDGETLIRTNALAQRRKMGYVIQEGGLFPHLSAMGNISLMARYLGWGEGKINSRAEELCGLTKFPEDALSRYPLQLSGGQRQRVSLMRALMLDPDIILLDEPLGSLDPLIRSELQSDLKEIFKTLDKTVVMVTHDIGEAGFLGDKIVFINGGEITQTGTIQELLNSPKDPFITRFINAQRSTLEFTEDKKV